MAEDDPIFHHWLILPQMHTEWRALVMSHLVFDTVDLSVLNVGGTNEEIVGDVVQVSTVLEPWASHTDVVGRALALSLDQNGGILHCSEFVSIALTATLPAA